MLHGLALAELVEFSEQGAGQRVAILEGDGELANRLQQAFAAAEIAASRGFRMIVSGNYAKVGLTPEAVPHGQLEVPFNLAESDDDSDE